MDLDRIRDLIISFTLVALIAAAGAIALFDFQSTEKAKDTSSVSNESVTITSLTGILENSALFLSISSCKNDTTQQVMEIGVTCNVSITGIVSVAGNFTTGAAYVDYAFYTPTYLMNITNNGLEGVANTTGYFGTAGTIAGVALLLTIVIGAFYFVTKEAK